ncbi:MAG TPA: ABC transporter ATP-binding protein [Polyangiales bacterium]|nr:ABC transporter ATP-binding protein [Polyangiales bacterium]
MSVGTQEPELQAGWQSGVASHRGFPLYRWALSYLWPYRRTSLLLGLISALEVLLGLLRPWPLKLLVDYGLRPEHPRPSYLPAFESETFLMLGCAAYLAVNAAAELMSAGHTQLQVTLGQRLVVDLRQQMFQHLQSLSLRFHLRRGTGDTIYHIENDAWCVENLTLSGIMPLAIALATLLAMFGVLWTMNWQLAVSSLAVLPVLYVVNRSFMERMIARADQLKEIESRGISFVQEVFSAIKVVKAFGRESHESDRFRVQGEHVVEAKTKLSWQESFYGAAINLVTSTGTALILYLGGRQVLGGEMTVGDLLVAMSYLASVFEPLSSMSRTFGKLQGSIASARRVLRTLANQPEVHDRPGAVEAPRLAGAVEFADVSFGYDAQRPVLDNIAFKAEPGQTVAVVGLTGAGKTTLVSLIPRFYDVSTGHIRIDGRDLGDYTVRSLREQIAIVLQDPLLLSGTIADNIRYGRLDATPDEVRAAAKAAYADDFIQRLPQGYDTRLGDDGVQLSGGERQRVSIARALLRDAPILILDEPTSSLDARAEAHIFEALKTLMRGRTTFVIAHRLSTVRHADRILVLEGGRVAGFGKHEENLETVPLYRELCERLAV